MSKVEFQNYTCALFYCKMVSY